MIESKNQKYILSICIPTFNRAHQVLALVTSMVSVGLPIEVVVHVDGSTDETLELLSDLAGSHANITLSNSENFGRASALKAAINRASGKFIMIYDDDDEIFPISIKAVVEQCKTPIAEDICGFIYHMSDAGLHDIDNHFPSKSGNFLSIRADQKLMKDKKEVILSDLLKAVVNKYNYSDRRVPTSLYWTRLALEKNVVCVNEVVGQKNYLPSGMTDTIKKLKKDSPAPMAELYKLRVLGFFRRRYHSVYFFLRSMLGYLYYSSIRVIPIKK